MDWFFRVWLMIAAVTHLHPCHESVKCHLVQVGHLSWALHMELQGSNEMMMIIIIIPPTTPKNIQKYTFYITWKQVNIKFIINMHNTILVKNYEKLLFIPWLASHIRWKVNLKFNIKSYSILYQNKSYQYIKFNELQAEYSKNSPVCIYKWIEFHINSCFTVLAKWHCGQAGKTPARQPHTQGRTQPGATRGINCHKKHQCSSKCQCLTKDQKGTSVSF